MGAVGAVDQTDLRTWASGGTRRFRLQLRQGRGKISKPQQGCARRGREVSRAGPRRRALPPRRPHPRMATRPPACTTPPYL